MSDTSHLSTALGIREAKASKTELMQQPTPRTCLSAQPGLSCQPQVSYERRAARRAPWSVLLWICALILLCLPRVGRAADNADAEGLALAREMLGQRPEMLGTNPAVLRIRQRGQPVRELSFQLRIQYSSPDSVASYQVGGATNLTLLTIRHGSRDERDYTLVEPGAGGSQTNHPAANGTMIPVAGSDFWVADLGLEFLHWPGQRIVNREMRRSRGCLVLESTNPTPAPGAYSRVRSWVDNEYRGILLAEAYDAAGKLLKVFTPNDPTKVEGRWQIEELEIRNVQTRSQSTIKFDLTPQ